MEALYKSVQEALSSSFRAEDKDLTKISSAFRDMRGGTVTSKGEMTPLDWVGQASMITAATARILGRGLDLHTVELRYTVAAPGTYLAMRQDTNLIALADHIRETRRHIDRWYIIDCLRSWAHKKPDHSQKWWSKHLTVPDRTLHSWRREMARGRRQGFEQDMSERLERSEWKLYAHFCQSGWVEW